MGTLRPLNGISNLVPQLPRQAWAVLGGHAVSAVGSGLTLPFLLVYFHAVRGIDLGVAGLAVAAIAVASLLGNPLGGWLADRIGARSTVIAGLMVSAAAAVGVASVADPWHAFAAAGLVGLGAAVTWPAEDALLATVVRPEQRSAAFSVRFATMNAGFGIGGLIAAAIVDIDAPGTFTFIYLADGASFLLFIPVLLALVPDVRGAGAPAGDGRPSAGGFRQVLRDRLFLGVWAVTALVVTMSYGQYHSSFPAYATGPGGISARALSLAFAANTLTVVLAQLIVLRLMAGRRRTRAIMLACALWALTWAITIVAGEVTAGAAAAVTFALAMVLFALGETLFSPTIPAIVNDLASDELRGRYNGTYTLAWTTGFMVGPAVAGFTLRAGLGSLLFTVLIVGCVLTALAARVLERYIPAEANLVARASPVPAEAHVSAPLEPTGKAVPAATPPPRTEQL
ncbi:MAG TPA: MFS transporter [Egibacteraceae bacterium]|nr:MFS transporter [Egibacteraceae bacterium]